jgi:hypothetical protein
MQMISPKKLVILSGTIRGQGHEAHCTLSALEVTLPGADFAAYAQYSVRTVSRRLPEGDYEVSVNEQSFAVRHEGGHWLSA